MEFSAWHRVGQDPNGVPRPASPSTGRKTKQPFEATLERTARSRRPQTREEDAPSTPPPAAEPEPGPTPGGPAKLERSPRPTATEGRTAAAEAMAEEDTAATAAAPPEASPLRPRATLADEPAPEGRSPSRTPELKALKVRTGPAPAPGGTGASTGGTGTAQATRLPAGTAARAQGTPTEGPGRALLREGQDPARSTRTRNAGPTFRTMSPQLLQLAQDVRDSVFRQVAFRIADGGGEMRVLLDPPELGQLDVKMLVDRTGSMQLSIVAERPELALMLDKHMADLRSHLAQQGLDVTDAEVHTGTRGDGDTHDPHREDGGGPSGEEAEAAPSWRRPGYITADGLDFWV